MLLFHGLGTEKTCCAFTVSYEQQQQQQQLLDVYY